MKKVIIAKTFNYIYKYICYLYTFFISTYENKFLKINKYNKSLSEKGYGLLNGKFKELKKASRSLSVRKM